MGLRDWARRKNRELHREALEDRDSKLWHSSYYHRYFEGYTEVKELDARGRERVRRIYTGTWYRQNLSKSAAAGIRILYAVLMAVMIAAVAAAGKLQGFSGTSFIVAVPELVTLCLLAWMLYTYFVNYLFAPERMSIYDYKSSSLSLIRAGTALTAAFLADLVCMALEYAFSGGAGYENMGKVLLLFAAGALCGFALRQIERRIPYLQETSAGV